MLNSISDLHGCRIYVALFPCNECTKVIVQAGIREIIYLSDKYKDTDSVRASKIILEQAGVTSRRFIPLRDSIVLRFNQGE